VDQKPLNNRCPPIWKIFIAVLKSLFIRVSHGCRTVRMSVLWFTLTSIWSVMEASCYHQHVFSMSDDFVTWLNWWAGDLAVVISCASMALADAGIVMYDLVPAVSLVWPFSFVLQRRVWHFFCIFTCILCLFYWVQFSCWLEYMTRLAIMPVGVTVRLSQHLVNCNSHCRNNVPSCFEVWELQITSKISFYTQQLLHLVIQPV
jgi:hypothetical protein